MQEKTGSCLFFILFIVILYILSDRRIIRPAANYFESSVMIELSGRRPDIYLIYRQDSYPDDSFLPDFKPSGIDS